jgi:hypothetical protein
VDGRIIVKSVLKEQDGLWTSLIWLRTGTSGHGTESSKSMKGGEFFDHVATVS